MVVTHRTSPSVLPEAVVVVAGPFEGETVERWERLIVDTLFLAPRRLVIDLAACPALDAAAVVVLLRAHREMVRAGGRLTLRAPAGRAGRILRLSRVDQVFDIEENERVAVAGRVVVGGRVLVGGRVEVGGRVQVGEGVEVSERVQVGGCVDVGEGVEVGQGVEVGGRVEVGQGVQEGEGVEGVGGVGEGEGEPR